MSSSAFFIEAAANTVMAFSCAVAGAIAPARTTRAAKISAMRTMVALHAVFARNLAAHADQALVKGETCDRRKRRSGNPARRAVDQDIAISPTIAPQEGRESPARPALYGFASGKFSTP